MLIAYNGFEKEESEMTTDVVKQVIAFMEKYNSVLYVSFQWDRHKCRKSEESRQRHKYLERRETVFKRFQDLRYRRMADRYESGENQGHCRRTEQNCYSE